MMISQKKNKIVPFVEMMNLEMVIQSKVSQKEKNKYCILMHIHGIFKDGISDPMYRAAKEKELKNGLLDSVRGESEVI